ncbi:MAG TPA: hypothetical protein VNA88_00450 [Candidatus Kapabacteria bacterium]|jgi:hypothetical protein|nr:hypothetical protein [Candidatus Kapabacteria bacterium]
MSDPETGEFEIDLQHCIWRECKGDLVELESFAQFNWITAAYRCTSCGRDFTVKIET